VGMKAYLSSTNHVKFMEIDDRVNFLYFNCFVALHKYNHNKHYICNHLCLHYSNCDGSFKTHTEFLHISSISPSWKKTYIHTRHFHKKILKPIVGVWDFLSNSFPNLFIKI
jgi:hypothetical protein